MELKDEAFLQAINGMKSRNPKLKVSGSIGGWNFPSEFWSLAVRPENRAKMVNQVVKYVKAHNLDGFDIDWEYPCSEKRMNPIQITCQKFYHVQDAGGHCMNGQFEHGACTG